MPTYRIGRETKMSHLVFVYGTLKKTGKLSYLLQGSKYSGAGTVMSRKWLMLDLGDFPGIVRVRNDCGTYIEGEVYEVDDTTLVKLDTAEAYPTVYNRVKVNVWQESKDGEYTVHKAWMYYIAEPKSMEGQGIVASGEWDAYHNMGNSNDNKNEIINRGFTWYNPYNDYYGVKESDMHAMAGYCMVCFGCQETVPMEESIDIGGETYCYECTRDAAISAEMSTGDEAKQAPADDDFSVQVGIFICDPTSSFMYGPHRNVTAALYALEEMKTDIGDVSHFIIGFRCINDRASDDELACIDSMTIEYGEPDA